MKIKEELMHEYQMLKKEMAMNNEDPSSDYSKYLNEREMELTMDAAMECFN